MRDVVDILVAAKAKIAIPETWTQGALARNSQMLDTVVTSTDAVCFCSVGALYSLTYGDSQRVEAGCLLNRAAGCTGDWNIVRYNDNHTHAEVMAVWDKAIELAKEGVV